jgi:broad specificity phosphatase PhoE
MRAIVVRHYKTESNRARNIIGWTESPPVTGWESDIELVVSRLQADGVKFDRVYSSDLTRAVNTGLFYAKTLDIPAVSADPALREINYGDVATKSKAWVEKHIPEHKREPDFVYPNGESFSQMQRRSVRFVEGLTLSHADQTLLLVVHAGVIRGLVSYFLGLEYAPNLRHKTSHSYIGDFHFEGSQCTRYDELGTLSGFVKDGVIEVPVIMPGLKLAR